MKIRPMLRFTLREWMRALIRATASGIGAIVAWFLAILATRDMPQAVSVAAKQGVWLLPAVIAILTPVLLFATGHGAGSLERES